MGALGCALFFCFVILVHIPSWFFCEVHPLDSTRPFFGCGFCMLECARCVSGYM